MNEVVHGRVRVIDRAEATQYCYDSRTNDTDAGNPQFDAQETKHYTRQRPA